MGVMGEKMSECMYGVRDVRVRTETWGELCKTVHGRARGSGPRDIHFCVPSTEEAETWKQKGLRVLSLKKAYSLSIIIGSPVRGVLMGSFSLSPLDLSHSHTSQEVLTRRTPFLL